MVIGSSGNGRRTVKLALLILTASLVFVYARTTSTGARAEAELRQRSRTNRRSAKAVKQARVEYSRFSHRVAAHQKSCDACHKFPTGNWDKVREGDDAFPDVTDYPEHPSCLGCHRQQFFKGAQPVICSICHTNPSPRDNSRHPFPNPSEIFDASKKGQAAVSEFAINFQHDKHVDIVGRRLPDSGRGQGVRFVPASFSQKAEAKKEESDPKSCAVCHQTHQPQGDSDEEFVTKPPKDLAENAFWLKKGTFKTSPRSHATCFNCHSQDSGLKPEPTDCATCHRLLPADQGAQLTHAHDDFDPKLAATMGIKDKATLEMWSRRDSAKFRHEWLPHAGLSCTGCHAVAAMNTLDERTKKVPVRSCGGEGTGCHIEATAEEVLNFEIEKKRASPSFECTKCHVDNGKRPIPETHINAISKDKAK